ncbi:MAG: hypothetical protein AB1499_15240 [Nitrospirota bacterium]
MNIWGFFLGLIIGVFPVLFILKLFKGQFLFIVNPYIKGGLFGLILWCGINVFLYLEARYNMLGLMRGEEGFGTMLLLTSSLQGFITAGIIAAFISVKLLKNQTWKS